MGAGRPSSSSCHCAAPFLLGKLLHQVVLTAVEQLSHMMLQIASSKSSCNALPFCLQRPDRLLYLHRFARLPS